jgi:cytochrome P450
MTADSATSATPDARWADLPRLPVLTPEFQEDPHRLLHQAREQSPVALDPFGLVALSYDAVRTVLRDKRFHTPQAVGLADRGVTSGPLWDWAATGIMSLNGEEHHRLRRLVIRAFTPASAAKLRAAMIAVITELTDPASVTGRCDIVADVARPYPIPVICELLGAPRQDWRLFSAWADRIFMIFRVDVADHASDILQAADELGAYIDEMVARQRHALGEDLISGLIRAEDDGDRLSYDELQMLVGALLTAGTDTTRNQLAAAIEVFCDHPDQWVLLAEHPELAPQAVDEVMRHTPVVLGARRIAVEDVELAGVAIPAGTSVTACTAAANRAPSVYLDPDRFDITRAAPEPMLTFGGGIHYCLGVHLAKAELAVALTVMARRMPNIRRTGPAPWKPLFGISGPITLPVQFDPGH